MKNLKSYMSIGLPTPKHTTMTRLPKSHDTRTASAVSKRRKMIRKLKHNGYLI